MKAKRIVILIIIKRSVHLFSVSIIRKSNSKNYPDEFIITLKDFARNWDEE